MNTTSPVHLAITCNGAVSLGAFEAGVFAQLYADVAEINGNGEKKVVIDAIAGASAGAVCATLLAQALTVSQDPQNLTNSLYDLWVNKLTFASLIGNAGNSSNSAFDPACLEDARQSLIFSDQQLLEGWQAKEPGPVALQICFTNLEGVPYQVAAQTGEPSNALLFADYEPYFIFGGLPYVTPPIEQVKSFGRNSLGRQVSWSNDVSQTTITSGSFPFAFKTQVIDRQLKGDFPGYDLLAQSNPGFPDTASFSYTDGGILDNEPIGRAIDASSYIDSFYGKTDFDWTYIIVEPDPMTVQDALNDVTQAPCQEEISSGLKFLPLGLRLGSTYFTDALYRDLANVVKTNDRIIATKKAFAEFKVAPDAQAAILKASGLDFKKPIEIGHIVSRTTLKGRFAGHFGGFFYQPYQQSDFFQGCLSARDFTKTWADEKGFPVPAKPYQKTDPGVGGCGFADIPNTDPILSAMFDRLKQLTRNELGLSGLQADALELLRGTIKNFIKDLLNKEGC